MALETLLAVFQILLAVGFVGFWIYFFRVENRNPARDAVYLGFERSFPVPDLCWATPCLVISAVGLLTGQRYGVFWTGLAGSALLFLGLLDISFNLRHGGYTTNKADAVTNVIINAVCVIFGPVFVWFAWIHF